MLRFLVDENLNNNIVRGLLRRRPDLDILRVQDVGLRTTDDPAILEFAALTGRILLTQDGATIPDFAYMRIATGLAMPGVFEISRQLTIRNAIDELLLLDEVSETSEWEGRVLYLPLR